MKRSMMMAIVLVVSAALNAHAQASTARSGILLALQDCSYDDVCGAATTYWIVREGSRVRVAARGAGLLVPRRDGFWWVGAAGGSHAFGQEGNDMIPCDTLRSADSTAARADDPDSMDESAPGQLWTARAGTSRDSTRYHLVTWGNDATGLDWVTGDWIAYTDRSVDYREHVHQSHALVTFTSLLAGSPDSVVGFHPDSAPWEPAERACLRRLFGAAADSSDQSVLGFGASYWTVRRDRTRWRVARSYYPNHGYDEGITRCDVPWELTGSMVGYDRVTTPWSAIKDVLPEARSAFESPNGDLLLVQSDSTWHAFLPREGNPGRIVARFTLGGTPVMAQWAVGAHAERWTREVTALLDQGPPTYRPEP